MGGLSERDTPFWPPQFTAPLMSKYLQVLYVRLTEFAEWYSNIRVGWVGRPDATLAEIVLGKSAKTFRPTNELWLVIQCSYRISETLLPINGVDDFNAVPDLLPALQASPFVKVYVLTATGLFQWSTATGWDEITKADPPQRERSSFEEFQAILHDPEWLADPEGRAAREVEQCLREFRTARLAAERPERDG
jgi:hypothetical protein